MSAKYSKPGISVTPNKNEYLKGDNAMKKISLSTLTCGVAVVVVLFAGFAHLEASDTMKPKKDAEMMMKTEGGKMMQEEQSMKPQGEAMIKEGGSMKQDGEMMMKEEGSMKQESGAAIKTESMKTEGGDMMKEKTTMKKEGEMKK